MSDKEKKYIQKVTGKFLLYGRAIDTTMLTALSETTLQQSAPTSEMMKQVNQLLDYLASQEDAIMTFQKSDKKLVAHIDSGYLNEPKARIRAGGHFYMSNSSLFSPINGYVITFHQIIKAVMLSAVEAELGDLFINAREAVYIRQML